MDWHPGISMHHIRSSAGAMSVLFGLGIPLVFFIGIPEIRGFLLASLPFACVVAAALWFWHKRRPVDLIMMGSFTGRQPGNRLHRKQT